MNLTTRLLAAIAGIAGFLASASANLTYTDGDLLLGFRATSDPGSTQDYVVNLGPASQFTQATGPITISSVGNIGADLVATFGADWKTRAEVLWGGVATDLTGDPANTLYATRPRADVGTPATPWTRRSNSGQGTTNSIFRAFFSGYTLSDANAVSAKGTIQSTSFANSYASFTSPNVDFGFFNGIEGNFGAGTAGSVLDLFRLTPTQQSAGQVFLGSFQLNDSGALTFTPAAPTAPTFRFDAATYSVNEDAPSGNMTIRVVRGGLTSGAETVQLDTIDGSALAGTDYTAKTAFAVAFAANETQVDVSVAIANRDGLQGNRAFTVALSNPSTGGLLVSPSTATVTINESTPGDFGQIAFGAATYEFAPVNNLAQPNNLAVTLSRANGTDGAVTVEVSVTGGTLINGTDFNTVASPTIVAFAAGEASRTFNIQLNAIESAKLPGTINLALGNVTGGATLGSTSAATVTVTAPDKIKPIFTLASESGIVTAPTFQVTGRAKDNNGIDRVEVKINGGTVQLATLGATANGKVPFDLSGIALENGRNRIVITAFDSSGNAAANQVLKVNYQNERPALAGTYNGLVTPSGTPSNNTTGFLTLTVSRLGLFTGKVTLGAAEPVPITGIFDNAGVAHFKVTRETTAAPTSLTVRGVVGAGTVDFGSLSLAIATDKVTGTLKDGSSAVVANIDTDRAAFDGKTPATSVDSRKGFYTVAFPARATQTGLTAADYPQGDGFGGVKVKAKGRVSLVGTLADGTAVIAAGPLSKDYRWPFYSRLYKKNGVISGFVVLDGAPADSDLKGADIAWIRPAVGGADFYPNGWSDGILTDFVGAKYSVPAGASVLPNLGAVDPADGNAALQFSDGKLAATLTKTINISTANVITNTPADASFKLVLTAANGLIAGKFTHSDGTRPTFGGVIFQKGPNAGAYGFFLSTPPAGGVGESGAVTLLAQ